MNELKTRKIGDTLWNVIVSYLSERKVVLEAETERQTIAISSGVTQGSELGTTLSNIVYDGLVKMKLPEQKILVGFADEIVAATAGMGEEGHMEKAMQR